MQAQHANVALLFRGDDFVSPDLRMCTVFADANKLSQVIRNLISNALKFTPSGGTVSIYAYVLPGKNNMRLEVHDTGCGISEVQNTYRWSCTHHFAGKSAKIIQTSDSV